MLLSSDLRKWDGLSDLDSIHNFYETLVFEEMNRILVGQEVSGDYLADVACVALNHLPPRYIRHDVDMMFYLSPNEKAEMDDKVKQAVAKAIEFVNSRNRES
jgi:hypothetical protein